MKNLQIFKALLLIDLLSFSSCGYQWNSEELETKRATLSVPFIKGDEEGMLTAALISSLSASGLFDVLSSGGDYELRVSILNEETKNIGFRIDPQKVDGKIRKNLLPVEGRREMGMEVSLLVGDQIAFGPYKIKASAEFDYVDGDSIQDLTFTTSTGSVITVLPFSLGQLESFESAHQAATSPLYRSLAQKVVDVLLSNWQ